MARNPAYDILIDGKGYMLARQEDLGRGGRAWSVTPIGASKAKQTQLESRYGNQPMTVEAPMVWIDGYLGYGDDRQERDRRYHYSKNIDCRFRNQIIPGPLVTELSSAAASTDVGKFIEFQDTLYYLAGRYLNKIETDYSITETKDFGALQEATDAIVFGDYLYIGFGHSGMPLMRYDGTSWTTAAIEDEDNEPILDESGDPLLEEGTDWAYRKFFGRLEDNLWGTNADAQVKSVAAGSNAMNDTNWSGAYNIGAQHTSITALGGLGDILYVGKTDGLHALDQSYISPMLTPELAIYSHADNCSGMRAWHGMWWVPTLRGLFVYQDQGSQGFRIQAVSPGRDVGEDNPVHGEITAIVGDDEWIYCALLTDDGNTYIVAGHTLGDEFVWHPISYLESVECQTLHISGLWTNPHLWMGYTKSGNYNVAYAKLPRRGGNPLLDDSCRYAASGSIYFPAHNWHSPASTKTWKSVDIEADGLSFTEYIDVFYRIDEGSWRELGRANVSPKHTLRFAETGVTGTKIQLRLDFTLGNSDAPIILRNVVVKGAERPESLDRIRAVLRCADRLPLRTGGYCSRSGQTILEDLRALASNDEAVELVNVVGESSYVLVQPSIEQQEIFQQGELKRELLLTVEMTKFEATETEPVTGAYAIYGTSTYGGGHVYR